MLHYFIVNPIAGTKNISDDLHNRLKTIFTNRNDHYEIYNTSFQSDATIQIRKVCLERSKGLRKDEHIRFYSCGGDGTSYECLNGLVNCENVSMAVLPTGSCNDFLKTFENKDEFTLDNLINGESKPIDIIRVNDRYIINACNIGYDAKVNFDCLRLKRKYRTIKKAYNASLVLNLLKPLGDQVILKNQDDEVIFEGKSLLLVFGNGKYYGGGFKCTPYGEVDDGLMEVVVIKKVNVLTFLNFVAGYKRGEHVTNPKRYGKLCTYQRATKVILSSPNEMAVCLDGENFFMKELIIELIPHKINFVFPR